MPDFLDKIRKLPEVERNFFLSDKPLISIKKSFGVYGVDSKLSEKIAEEISFMYVGDIAISKLPQVIKSKIQINDSLIYGISSELVKRIFSLFPNHFKDSATLLNQWLPFKSAPSLSDESAWQAIIQNEPWLAELEKESDENRNRSNSFIEPLQKKVEYAKITISQAMRDFPKINEQKITEGYIKPSDSQYPLQPTVKNWIGDFYSEMGAGSHNIIERGNYLFHSANTKKLSSPDRQKLAIILKSLSEGVPLLVDPVMQKIVFPEMKRPAANIPAPSIPSNAPPMDMMASGPKLENASQNKNIESVNLNQLSSVGPKAINDISPRPATTSDFRDQPRFKIQDEFQKPEPEISDDGEQLRKKYFDNVQSEQKINSENKKSDEDLGKIEFSSPQVMPAEKEEPMPVAPASRVPIPPVRILPIGRNGNVV
jgi:hypothetical protein